MSYEIIQKFISNNRSRKQLNAVGSVVHETATPNASDENEYSYFNNAYRGASAHAFVDCDSISQLIPWDEQAWHAGGTANRTRIGIELCHYDDETRFNEVWKGAVWLFAWVHVNIIKQTTINTDNLMSHAEVSNKWHETNHQDPISYFAQFGKTVNDFRNAVQNEINNMIKPNIEEEVKVKNLVVYGNSIDRRASEYLADYLGCPTLDGNIPYDYSNIENVICVGGKPKDLDWTSYAKKIITGSDRYDTMIQVLKYINKL
jgi:N-acetyl-anhydromuramyl-L-alanine amidase AmpD